MRTPLHDYWDLLVDYLRPEGFKAGLLVVLLLGSIGLQLLNPQIMRSFIDAALAGASVGSLATYAVAFIAVGALVQVFQVGATYVGQDVGWSATNRLREDLAGHCLRLDLAFFHARTPGELIERIDGDVTALSNFFSQLVVRVFGSALLVLGTLVLIFRESLLVGVVLTGFAGFALVVLNWARDLAVPQQTGERQATAQLFGFLEERLAGLDDTRANGAGRYAMRRFHERLRDQFVIGRKAILYRSVTWVLVMGLFTVASVLVLGLGGYLYLQGAVTLGTVYLFFQYANQLEQPIELITNQIQELQRATASIHRTRELRQIPATIVDGPGAPIATGPLPVELDRVSFRYADEVGDDLVLRDLSFRLGAGQVLGLLGRTGSGKTTISRLLFRFLDPTAGAVRIGGTDTRAARLAELRQRVAIVTQDVQLFSANVRDNLTLFDRSISDERLLAVIHELGLDEWYAKLPEGLDTPLGAGGAGLSAGEAQLLAFVRVFLRDPGLVILDEASSRLDPATERLIEHAVDKLLANRTGVIIAHRLATVQRADEIIILEDGQIREQGQRAELARAKDSRFAQLLRVGMEEVLT
jgi:ABC-type multidrug transport system fused ATPase/permease subunit